MERNKWFHKLFWTESLNKYFDKCCNDFVLFQRTCAMLFEWRIQINWLLENQCAAFIATGKPWMDCGKWHTHTKGKQKEMRMHRPFVKRFICISHVGTYNYYTVSLLSQFSVFVADERSDLLLFFISFYWRKKNYDSLDNVRGTCSNSK